MDIVSTISSIKKATSVNKKKEIIRENKNNRDFADILFYAFNPSCNFGLSEQMLRKPSPRCMSQTTKTWESFRDMCEELLPIKKLDDDTVVGVIQYLRAKPYELRELYIQTLSKTLKIGVGVKIINSVIPGLIPDWEVQQAFKIEKYPLIPGTWFTLTQKLNGVRATYYHGKLYARSGDIYAGLDHIIEEIEECTGDLNYVFDGELTLLDNGELTDNEAFRLASGIINAKNPENKTRICYTIFDCLPVEEFERGCSVNTYSQRREILDCFSRTLFENATYTKILPALYQGTDQTMIDTLLNKMVQEDKEGLIVNLDVPYRRCRHRGILKVKRFYTMDLPIVRCIEGTGKISVMLGSFVLDYKGSELGVGSGFTERQRDRYWTNRKELIGELCEVKYKEVTYDKATGKESLQFPTFVSLRKDKTEVSYD